MLDNDNDNDDGEDEGHGDTDDGNDAAQAEHTVLILLLIFKETSLDISCYSCWIKDTPEVEDDKINVFCYFSTNLRLT